MPSFFNDRRTPMLAAGWAPAKTGPRLLSKSPGALALPGTVHGRRRAISGVVALRPCRIALAGRCGRSNRAGRWRLALQLAAMATRAVCAVKHSESSRDDALRSGQCARGLVPVFY